MSGTLPANPPDCHAAGLPAVELLIDARPRDLGGFSVRRLLPSSSRRLVGPFIFFDHIGPARLELGAGLDVRPHPHIGLATVTYLYDGEIDHRDSLGSFQPIRPGDVNWMVAGRGIAHSERSGALSRREGVRIHGIQSWVALPIEHEEVQPSFAHHPAATIPSLEVDGALVDVIAGTSYGVSSPAAVLSPTLYVHARLAPGARLPVDEQHENRAVYVVEGSVSLNGHAFQSGTMAVLRPGSQVLLEASSAARVMLLGGATLSGERHVWWNFVSSSKERIELAKADWKRNPLGRVPGDELEFTPLPEF